MRELRDNIFCILTEKKDLDMNMKLEVFTPTLNYFPKYFTDTDMRIKGGGISPSYFRGKSSIVSCRTFLGWHECRTIRKLFFLL
jgi:hypothetical protein